MNLINLALTLPNCIFEAELFPALHVNHFVPFNINVFARCKEIG